jgi:hypothetical protein
MALQVGDRVRVVAWPPEFERSRLHAETTRFYERVIEEGIVLKVSRIDDFGVPYGDVMVVTDGIEEWHSVGLNHSEVEVVSE